MPFRGDNLRWHAHGHERVQEGCVGGGLLSSPPPSRKRSSFSAYRDDACHVHGHVHGNRKVAGASLEGSRALPVQQPMSCKFTRRSPRQVNVAHPTSARESSRRFTAIDKQALPTQQVPTRARAGFTQATLCRLGGGGQRKVDVG
jgi:hypothetical protein